MTKAASLKSLYDASNSNNAYEYAPRKGYYLIKSTYELLGYGLMATAIWKPLDSTKSSPGIEVQVHLEIFCNSSGGPKELIKFGEIDDCVLEVNYAQIEMNSQNKKVFRTEWTLHRYKKRLSKVELNNLMNSGNQSIIDSFLSDKNNLALYVEDEIDPIDCPDEDDWLDYDTPMEIY